MRLKYWTEREDNILKNCYENSIKEEILKKIPNRSWIAIGQRASKFELARQRNKRLLLTSCFQCNKFIKVYQSRLKNSKRVFCSLKCKNKYFSEYYKKYPPNYNKIEIKCSQCEKPFKRSISEATRHNHNFCSNECFWKWFSQHMSSPSNPKWQKVKFKCEICGKEVYQSPSAFYQNKRHFCSQECKKKFKGFTTSKNRKKTIQCLECGEDFKVSPSRTIGKKKRKFCSKICYNKYLKEKIWTDIIFRERQIEKIIKGSYKRPTSYEQKIIDLCKKYDLPFKYVGDGKLIINYGNPDFINYNGKKQIIETYCNFWHPENYEEERRKRFAKFGFKTLFLDDNDLTCGDWEEKCLIKIQNFTEDIK